MPQGRLSTTGDATWPARCYGVGVLMWCCMAIASGLWRTPHSSEGRPCIPRRHKEALVAAQWRQYFLTRAGFVFGLMQVHLAVIAQDNQGRARNDMAPVTRSITAFSSDGLGTSYTNSFARPLFNAVVVAVSWIMAGEHWLYRASTIAATCGGVLSHFAFVGAFWFPARPVENDQNLHRSLLAWARAGQRVRAPPSLGAALA